MNKYVSDKLIKLENLSDEEIISKLESNHKSVQIINMLSDADYDNLLSNNVVFLNLIEISACNTLIECIVRNTPIIVNKIPGVVELLGADYPLYYDNIDQVENLLTYKTIEKAYNHLKCIDKSKFTIDYFLTQLTESNIYKI